MTLTVTPDGLSTGGQAFGGGFDVRTSTCDASRANLQVSGYLDTDSAALLQQVIDGHVRAGRRYLRLHVSGVRSIDDAAIAVIASTHDRLLALGGTLILTGVHEAIDEVLRAATPASPLLLLAVTAAENSY